MLKKVTEYNIFHLPPVTQISDDYISFRLKKNFHRDKANLEILVDVKSPTYKALLLIANRNFNHQKTREAFVKAYYLYEFLLQRADLGNGEFTTRDIESALGISQDTRCLINHLLSDYYILSVYDEDHNASVKRMIEGQQKPLERFKYGFHTLSNQYLSEKSKPRIYHTLSFKITSDLYEILKNRGFLLKDEDDVEMLSQKYTIYSSGNFDDNVQCSNGLTCKELNIFNNSAPYGELRFSGLTVGVCREKGSWGKLISWFRNREKAPTFSSGRWYHSFHNLPKKYRQYLCYNDEPLEEAMDVHNCFYVLMGKLFETFPEIEKEELESYKSLVRSGKFYEDVMEFLGIKSRDYIKERLQGYRNDYASGMKNDYADIDSYFQVKFPSIRQCLMNYPRKHHKTKKKTVKTLQVDAGYIESYLMGLVVKRLKENFDVTPFPLHDAIYLNRLDVEIIDSRIKQPNIINRDTSASEYIEGMFWEEYDKLEPQKVQDMLVQINCEYANI